MSDKKWTADQQQVIDLRERNILVSAAAGSGKTAVLVERIIQEVLDASHPVDVDRLLVVTFTKAAAGEMRTRIGEALEKRLLEQPENEHLQKQLSLLHNAQITTIDSFCQNIIRNYFHVIDLDPVFRVADETELTLMQADILQEVLEERYASGSERFGNCVDAFATGRMDHEIEDLILHLHQIAESYPWPMEWLDQIAELYQSRSPEEWEQSRWVQELLQYLDQMTADYYKSAVHARNLCMESDGPAGYLDAIESDLSVLEMLNRAKSLKEYAQAFSHVNVMRLGRNGKDVDKEKQERVKNLRELYMKKGVLQLQEAFFFQPLDAMFQDMQQMKPLVQELVDVTREFKERFAQKKRDEGIVDFSDMEHFALEILVDRNEKGEAVPSVTAKELQEYYQEILTDEYQDSNFIQELILTSLCRAPEQAPYMFMVGDVKQSIYQFRLARPELFNQKYREYTVGKGPYQRIDLHKNFRSRAMVLESANYLFRCLMQKSLGGIVYNEEASLVPGAEFAPCEQHCADKTEVLLVDRTTEGEAWDKVALEAAAVGDRIRSMVQGDTPFHVSDGAGGYRPIEYRDIVILLRSPSKWTDTFIETLSDLGIPAYSETKTGYFSTMEVETILNFLRVIDNPRQDIPMAGVLRSCLAGLTDEEMAWIGAMPRELNYQDAVAGYIRQMQESPEENSYVKTSPEAAWKLYDKLSDFWDRLNEYRQKAQILSVYELLRLIYQETGYYHIMAAMPAGEKRAANLDILLQQAIEFAANGHNGIFPFVRYIESLHKSDIDFGEASLVNEQTNAVRLMSIHKSKGLEFPVVFVAGLGKQFNFMDARSSTIIDADYGIGASWVDLEKRLKQPTLLKKFIANRIKLNTLAEEVRVLYVALTRAKEQLILTGTVRNLAKQMEKWTQAASEPGLSELTSAGTYLDWIMPVVTGIGAYPYFCVHALNQEELVQGETHEMVLDMSRYEQLTHWDTERTYDEAMREAIRQQTQYQYPYAAEQSLPVKISVTELKRLDLQRQAALRESEDGIGEVLSDEVPEKELVGKAKLDGKAQEGMDDTVKPEVQEQEEMDGTVEPEKQEDTDGTVEPGVQEQEEPDIPRPKFLAGEHEVSGAARGTLYHMVMEHLPYERIWKEWDGSRWSGLDAWLEELRQAGYMTEEEKALLKPVKFQRFLQTSLGQRMLQAGVDGRLYREQPFMMGFAAKDLYQNVDSKEMVLVQGIIDAFFYEGEDIILVDYKTDYVASGDGQELVNQYHAQLGYYTQALERVTGHAVREQIIYSFGLGKEIILP